jgi:hypothetical protein
MASHQSERRWGQRHPQEANSGSNGKLKLMLKSKQLPPAHPYPMLANVYQASPCRPAMCNTSYSPGVQCTVLNRLQNNVFGTAFHAQALPSKVREHCIATTRILPRTAANQPLLLHISLVHGPIANDVDMHKAPSCHITHYVLRYLQCWCYIFVVHSLNHQWHTTQLWK